MNSPEQKAVQALKSISRNENIKAYLLQNKPLYNIALKSAMRFIGGETFEECVENGKKIAETGHAFTIDFMGESIRDKNMANEATEEFLRVIDVIITNKLPSSISLDLSHIGSLIDEELAYQNALRLAEAGIEMMISMEGSDRIDSILDIYKRLVSKYPNVGITIQAYLYRTPKDLQEMLKLRGKIRLVKGAFQEDENVAMVRGEKVDGAYKKCLEELLQHGHTCSIATHDAQMVTYAKEFITKQSVDTSNVEFEMLKGITPEILKEIQSEGYKTRVYLPYGKEWYLYLCHRLAENPENIYEALANMVK